MTIGLVTEGISDQIVISNILYGYFNDDDLLINELQPLRDETDKNKSSNYGGWGNLIEYCKSEVFKTSFQLLEYVVIQIDTDICESYNISKKENGVDLSVEKLVEKVEEKIIGIIGVDFYTKFEEQIIFAISVHSIECWILPVYYSDRRKSKTENCLNTLNQKLNTVEGFSIDPNNKSPKYYDEISEVFSKRKKLIKFYKSNPSFEIFINNLDKRFNLL